MKRKNSHIGIKDFLKANRAAARKEDIEEHGHPTIFRSFVHISKKTYSRKRARAGMTQDIEP